MKILIVLLFISITLGSTKKKKDRKSVPHSDFSSETENGTINVLRNKKREIPNGLNSKGILRQTFALEAALQDVSSNVVCSPVSALMPLAKLALGAEGRSRRELFKMIGESDKDGLSKNFKKIIKELKYLPGAQLDIASRLYVSNKAELDKKFVKDSKRIFESSVEKLSFKNPKNAADEINKWVSRQTKDKIPQLLTADNISPHSSLVIANAIYFRGKWHQPFNKVEVGVFYSLSGEKKVQMMSKKTDYKYTKSSILNAQIVEIPYEGKQSSFIIVLPLDKTGLPILLSQLKLAPNLLNKALKEMEKRSLKLSIPKFKITSTLDLKDMYEKIGIKHITGDKSGLSGIIKGEDVKVSSAIQKAVIEVHERGTEAAAGSGLDMQYVSAVYTETFNADHPFLFYVLANREQLFAGVFTEP